MQKSIVITDCSFYQDDNATPRKIDFNKMKSTGAQGCILRVGQGAYLDEDFFDNFKAAKSVLPRGVYWYYDSRVAPLVQAKKFADAILQAGLPEMEVWADYEENYEGAYKGWKHFSVFLAELQKRLPAVKIGIYTGYYYWNSHCPNEYLQAASFKWFAQFPLWIAWYTTNDTIVKIPRPWTSALLWQFTSHGDGLAYGVESLNIDRSYFQGTQDEFNARYSQSGTPAPTFPHKYRIKDDVESGRATRNGLPSTVRLQGGKMTTLLSPVWMDYVYQIQNMPNYQFSDPDTLKDSVGWHNSGAPNKVEQVVFSGNVLEVTKIEGNKAYIKSVPVTDNPPMLGGQFVLVKPVGGTHPLIHNFSIQYTDHLDLTTDERYARTIVFSNPGESLWIDTKEIVRL